MGCSRHSHITSIRMSRPDYCPVELRDDCRVGQGGDCAVDRGEVCLWRRRCNHSCSHSDDFRVHATADIIRCAIDFCVVIVLLVHRFLGLPCVCFADPNALIPRATKISVPNTSTVFKPRTPGPTTAKFAGFLNNAALRAYGTDDRCRYCQCLNVYRE